MTGSIDLPYGRSVLRWQPPADLEVALVGKAEPEPLPDPSSAIDSALGAPLDAALLEELAQKTRRISIVVTDATRPCPDHLLVSAIVDRLARAGVRDSAVTLVVAIGMHRASTAGEKIEKLGAALASRFRVVDSAPLDPAMQVDLGVSPDGVPVRIDRRAAEADLLIATGIVEPHQYAGFSGGWKTVAIGTAAAATISALHGMRYLEDPGVRLANTEGNPFLETARWIGEKVGLRFVVNVALDSAGRITNVLAGAPESVHHALSGWVRDRAIVQVPDRYPIVVGAAGHPKDSNLYQATRIPTYLCFSRSPVIEPGGVIIVPAACPEAAGQGPGERLFFEKLTAGLSSDELIDEARRHGFPAGGQRAVMVAWARKRAQIAFVGPQDLSVSRACGFPSFQEMDEAIGWARDVTGSRRALVVPHALTTLPEAPPAR